VENCKIYWKCALIINNTIMAYRSYGIYYRIMRNNYEMLILKSHKDENLQVEMIELINLVNNIVTCQHFAGRRDGKETSAPGQ
jgi:hypothetical protein